MISFMSMTTWHNLMNLNILHSHVVMSDTYDYKCNHGSSHKMKVLVYNVFNHFFFK
jgi:hypothetical protein